MLLLSFPLSLPFLLFLFLAGNPPPRVPARPIDDVDVFLGLLG